MANPFLEDYINEVREAENRKTQIGSLFEDSPLVAPIEPDTKQAEKNVLYDVAGSTLWAFADSFAFGVPGMVAETRDTEASHAFMEAVTPITLPGKFGAAIGSLGGFVMGAPMKLGAKALQVAAKPFIKKAVKELGEEGAEKFVIGSAKKISKTAIDQAVDKGVKKEVAEQIVSPYLNTVARSVNNKNIAKNFVEKSGRAIDDAIGNAVLRGDLTADQVKLFSQVIKKDLTRRPLQNFKDLAVMRGSDWRIGNLVDETVMFGLIDAVFEVPHSIAQDRPYDPMNIAWGASIGLGFGALKWLNPIGKGASFKNDLVDGIKASFGKIAHGTKTKDALLRRAQHLSEIITGSGDDVALTGAASALHKTITRNGRTYFVDLASPTSLFIEHGEDLGRKLLAQALDETTRSYGKEMVKWSIKEEASSLAKNWFRMTAGGLMMNARSFYDMTYNEADIPLEDVLPGVLIGAFLNRKGSWKQWDLNTETNRMRKNLAALGAETRNLVDIPTFNPYRNKHLNPIDQNETLQKARDKAEELGIINDSWEVVNQKTDKESVTSNEFNKGGLEVFRAFYRLLSGQRKFEKPKDNISVDDALQIEKILKEGKFDLLGGKSIKNAQDAYRVFDSIVEGSSETFERGMVNIIADLKKLGLISQDINLDHGTMGEAPREILFNTVEADGIPALLEYAKQGRLKSLKNDSGEVLSGQDAVDAMTKTFQKVNRIIQGLGNERGISRLKLVDPTLENNTVRDAETFDALFRAVDNFETQVGRSVGMVDSKFNINHMLDDVIDIMQTNNAKKATQEISRIMSQGEAGHDVLVRKLIKSGLLSDTDGISELTLVAHANKVGLDAKNIERPGVEITGLGDNPIKEAQYRRFLQSIVSILGAKGQYKIKDISETIKVDYRAIDDLKDFLGSKGMRTDPGVLEQWNNYIVNYIIKDTIKGSNIQASDLNVIQQVSATPGLDVIKFNTKGAKGWEVRKIKSDFDNEIISSQVEKWNTFVDDLLLRGKTDKGDKLISENVDPYILINKDSMTLLSSYLDFMNADIQISAKRAATDFINSISAKHPTFVAMMEHFTSVNGRHSELLINWLVGEKILIKEASESYIKFRYNEKGLTDDTLSLLKVKMENFGIHESEVDLLYKRELQNVEDMVESHFSKPKDDATMSRDTFFREYVPAPDGRSSALKTPEDQNAWISTLLGIRGQIEPGMLDRGLRSMWFKVGSTRNSDGSKKSFKVLGDNLNLSNPDHLAAFNKGKEHLVSQLLTRLGSRKINVLSWFGGNVFAKESSVYRTKFLNDMDDIGLDIFLVTGTADNYKIDGRGNIRNRRFNIFEGEGTYLTKQDRADLKVELEAFNNQLESLTTISVGKSWTEKNPNKILITGNNQTGGMALFRIAANLQPFAVRRFHLPEITKKYEEMIESYKDDLAPETLNTLRRQVQNMKDLDPGYMKSADHEIAMRNLLFEKLTTSDNDKSTFIQLLEGKLDAGKIAKRFSLYHTPNFKIHNRSITEQSAAIAASEAGANRQKFLTDKFHKSKGYTARVAIWADEAGSSIKEDMLGNNETYFNGSKTLRDKYWKEQLHGREDASSFDSITYISKDMMEYLSMAYGFDMGETNIFKPVINSSKETLLMSKTVFVYDPFIQKSFFKNNNGVDILTTESASKIVDGSWNLISGNKDQLFGVRNAEMNNSRRISLDDIVIKPDRVKHDDYAKMSQSTWNYTSSLEAGQIYGQFYGTKLTNAMSDMHNFFSNGQNRRAFFNSGFFADQSVESMLEGLGGSQALGGARIYAGLGGDPMDLGDKMIMNQFYRKVIDPIVNQSASLNGVKYGGKSVLIRSLDPRYKTKATLAENGVVKQHGEVFLPHYERDASLSTISTSLKKQDLQIRLVNTKTNKLEKIEDIFGKNYFENEIRTWTLGQLHDRLAQTGLYQVGVVTNRYPRTRPNDLTVLGLKGFLEKAYGNSMIANDLDVLNIFEGDYDVDKNDYFWMHGKDVFDHIQRIGGGNFIQGIDPAEFQGSIDNLALTGPNSGDINSAWHEHIANASVLKKQIGTTQKQPRIFNFMKDIATEVKAPDGSKEYVMYSKGGTRVTIDYDNMDWFMRTVVRTQAIIDAGSATEAVSRSREMNDLDLFPLIEESLSSETISSKIGYINDLRSGASKRVRLFRKFQDGKEVDLHQVDKDVLTTLMKQYSDLLTLGTDIFENTGQSKKPGYHDIMDVSESYFTFTKDINKSVFYKLNWKHKEDMYWKDLFFPKKVLKKSAEKKKSEDIDIRYDFKDITQEGPFSSATQEKGQRISVGEHGNVFDRIMNKIYRDDPMKVREYDGLTGKEVDIMEEALYRFTAEPDQLGEFSSNIVGFVTDHNKAVSTLKFLQSKWGYINRQKMNKKAKDKVLNGINEQVVTLRKRLWDLLPQDYRKSLKGSDLKDGYITFTTINSRELKESTRELYMGEALRRLSGVSQQVKDEINLIHDFERRAFGDMSNSGELGTTLTYGKATVTSPKMREWLKNVPDYATVEEILDHKLQQLLINHGGSALWHYAGQGVKKNQIGIFNGQVVPVPYGKNARMSRTLKFLSKRAHEDVDARNMLKYAGLISNHYRNYFEKNWRLLSTDNIIDKNFNINMETVQFPKFSKQFENAFQSWKSFRWKNQTGMQADPFNIQQDYQMKFYKEYFHLMGGEMGTQFDQYTAQLETLNRILASNETLDPIRYLSVVTKMNKDIHDFASTPITGGKNEKGHTFKIDKISDELKQNPVWALLGGGKYFKGLTLNPATKTRQTNLKSLVEFSKQANTMIENRPSEGKTRKILERMKACGYK